MKTTIVSAFFDIKRENYSTYSRSVDQYFQYFERWARIKNDLVFFCENKEFGEKVLEIRNKFGLKEKTQIEVIDDICEIDPELLSRMQEIEKNGYFLAFRKSPTNPENKAMYNYVMLIKFYCMKRAADLDSSADQFAWIDFGFEHGGACYADENDYAFEWNYDFGEKVTCFYIEPMDTRPMFEICKEMEPVCIMGAPIVVHRKCVNDLWQTMLENEKIFAEVGLMDDDQPFLLMASRRRPEMFELKASDWFLPIHDFGGSHMKIKEKEPVVEHKSLKQKIKKIIKKILGKS